MSRQSEVKPGHGRNSSEAAQELRLLRILVSLPMYVIVLDREGKVTHTSSGAHQRGRAELLPMGPSRVGACYLGYLQDAFRAGDNLAAQISAGVVDVLRGDRSNFNLEYQRNLEGDPHSFLLRVDNINDPPGGAVVSQVDTTERSRAEAALRDLHDRYAFATLAGGVGLWDLDVRSRDLYVDPSLIELLGFDRSAVGTTIVDWSALTTAEDRSAIRYAVARCLRGEALAFEVEHRLLGREGQPRWFLTRGNVILDSDGKPLRLVGLSTDITERKEAELAIEREGAKYRQIFDAAGVAIWEVDYSIVVRWLRRLRQRGVTNLAAHLRHKPQLVRRALRAARVCDVNTEAMHLTGALSKTQLLALPLHELLLDGERQFRQQLLALAGRRRNLESEAAIRTATGEKRDIVLVVRFPNVAREFDSVLLCAQDVTQLVERRRRYELATSAGGVTVFELDLATRELHTDPPLHALLGIDLQSPATLQDMVDRIHPEDGPRVLSTERLLLADHAPRDDQGNTPIPEFDFRLRDAQGHCRWFLKRGTVIRNSEGKALKLVGTITDITGQIRMEEKVRRSHEQVRELARRLIAAQEHEQNRIACDLHDGLCTQLSQVVTGLAELEALLGSEPPAVRRELGRLQTDLRGLGDAIRSLSRQMHPGAVEPVQLLPALRQLCNEFTRVQGVEVVFACQGDHDATPPDITISLYRVTQEALRNIAKHSGAKKAEVTLTRRASGILLRIRDWGNGFHTPVGPPRGLGLLSIQERARLVGGQAYVLSAPGRGTEVRVTVPVHRA